MGTYIRVGSPAGTQIFRYLQGYMGTRKHLEKLGFEIYI